MPRPTIASLRSRLDAISRSRAMAELDAAGTFRTVNPRFLALLGCEGCDLVGKHHRELVSPEVAASERYADFWRSLAAGEEQTGVIRRKGRDGRPMWLRVTYSPILDGDDVVTGIIALATDLTEAVLREADARSQLEALQRAQAVIEFELDGTIITANDNFLDALGYGLDEIRGRHHRMFVRPEEAVSEEYREFWAGLAEGRFAAGQYCRVGKDGRELWIQASYNPVLDGQGRPVKVVKYATDITDRRRSVQAIEASILALADGDLTLRVDGAIHPDFVPLRDAVQHTLHRLQSLVQQVNASAELVADASAVVQQGTNDLKSRAETLSRATEEVAATMERLSVTIKENRASSELASARATDAHERASRGGEVIGLANDAMQGIEQTSDEISQIIGVIDEIAFQTNLVALNAAMEAARSGEHGRGFQVVAGEIRLLAKQSAEGATEIRRHILRSRDRVAAGSRHVRASGETLDRIIESVAEANQRITGVERTTREQARALEHIEAAIEQVRSSNHLNTSFVGETVKATVRMTEASQALLMAMTQFRVAGESADEPIDALFL